MKKILLLSFSLLFLSACGIPFIWSDENEESSEEAQKTTTEFRDENISITIPTSWEEIWSNNLPVPKTGNIALALKSSDQIDDIYRTMVILEDRLIWNLSSSQYARNDYRVSIKNYSGFREISEKEITYIDGDISKLYTFEAKYNPDSPRMRFLQSSKICSEETSNKVYNTTIALPPSVDDLEKYEALIKSLSCVKKEES